MGHRKVKDWGYLSRLTGKPPSHCLHMWRQILREQSPPKSRANSPVFSISCDPSYVEGVNLDGEGSEPKEAIRA